MLPAQTLEQQLVICMILSRPHHSRSVGRVGGLRTWVMPIDRHSSSHSNFRVPLDVSKYSLGMAFNMGFGSWTWRYSHSSSEYLPGGAVSKKLQAVAKSALSRDIPRRVVNGLEKLLQACALVVGQGTRLCVTARRVDAHVIVGSRHFGGVVWCGLWWSCSPRFRGCVTRKRQAGTFEVQSRFSVATIEYEGCCRGRKPGKPGQGVGKES